jgi:hypothetical protein
MVFVSNLERPTFQYRVWDVTSHLLRLTYIIIIIIIIIGAVVGITLIRWTTVELFL